MSTPLETHEPSSASAEALSSAPTTLLIGGQWRGASTGAVLPVENPASGEVLAEVADASADDARAALDAACAAQRSWAATPPRERGEILRRAYEAMLARIDELALVITLEMGKPLKDARAEVSYAADFFHWFAGEASRIEGRFSVAEKGAGRVLVSRAPVGPCLLITPWNFPLAMGTRKIGPAIAAGCTMVVKPAKQTPLSMLLLAEILEHAGVPPGVLNVIVSASSGSVMEPLLADARSRKLSFTGSTEVGSQLMAQASRQLLRLSMELGGNAPFMIFEDADLEEAVDGAIVAKMRNMGEACTAANRFLVHASVAGEFSKALADSMSSLRVGPGTDPESDVGPIIDGDQRDRISNLVQDALRSGARLEVGGRPLGGGGYFFEPTVLSGVPENGTLIREEIFGPVAPIQTFDNEAEAIHLANNTRYGLVAYAYTRSLDRTMRLIDRLETGMLGMNQSLVSSASAPFGGVKHSGFGREGGPEGIDEYLVTKYTAIRTPTV